MTILFVLLGIVAGLYLLGWLVRTLLLWEIRYEEWQQARRWDEQKREQ